HADRRRRERHAGIADHGRALLDRAVGQGNIGGDHDVAFAGALGDPVVGGIEAVVHHDPLDARIARHVDVAVGDDEDLQAVTLGHPVDLGLDRTGIGIYLDLCEDRTAFFLRSISLKSIAAPRPGPLGTCTSPSRPTTMSCSRPYFCAASGSRTSKNSVFLSEAMTCRLATLFSELPPWCTS